LVRIAENKFFSECDKISKIAEQWRTNKSRITFWVDFINPLALGKFIYWWNKTHPPEGVAFASLASVPRSDHAGAE
jgi:hypothetical protein